MSLFFKNERHPKVEHVDQIPDWDAALQAVSERRIPEFVSAVGRISVEQARDLAQTCRKMDSLLMDELQAGRITTQAAAVDFIRTNTEGFFPAVRFVNRMKEIVGSEATPATWAQVLAAALAESV